MMRPSIDEINALKDTYPPGSRIRCIFMDDRRPVPPNTMGTVRTIDDMGQIHVSWDNGSRLALNVDDDLFESA